MKDLHKRSFWYQMLTALCVNTASQIPAPVESLSGGSPKSHGSPWLTDKWRTSLHRNWGHVSIKLRPEQQITARTPPSEQAPANRILVLASVKDLRWAPINDESYFFIRIDSRPAKNLYSLDESTLLDIVVSANLNRNPSHWPKAAATQVALNLLSTVESPREDD